MITHTRIRWKRLFLLAACLLAPTHGAATPPDPAWTSADLSLALPGRTFRQTREAFPAAPIQFELPPPAGETVYSWMRVSRRKMLVPQAFRIGDQTFDFMLRHEGGPFSQSYLVASSMADDPQACQARFAGFIDGLGPALGLAPKHWDVQLRAAPDGFDPFDLRRNFGGEPRNTRRIAELDGYLYGHIRTAIATPLGAQYGVLASDNPATLTPWFSEWFAPDAPYAVRALGHFGQAYAGLPGNCHIAAALIVQGRGDAPPPLPRPMIALPLLDRAALSGPRLLSQLYYILADLEQSPRLQAARAAGETFPLSCAVRANDGSLANCNPAAGLRAQDYVAANLLGRMGNAYRLTDWKLDEDTFTDQPVLIDFKLSPDDALPLIDWDNAPLISTAQMQARAGWPGHWFRINASDYPMAATIANAEADIDLECLILADQSLFCDRFVITPEDKAAVFARAITTIKRRSQESRVAPLLKDGTPAAGKRFPLKIRFILPEAD